MGKFVAQPIADGFISYAEYESSGCPVCNSGEKRGAVLVRANEEVLLVCAHCRVAYTVKFTDEVEGAKE